jgi:hypothetical protein
MILGKPERVPRPHSNEPFAVIPKRMPDHVVDAVRLRRAPDHDVEPCARAGRKEVRTKGREVWAGHYAAWRRAQVRLATGCARRSWGTQEECAV